MSNAISRDPSVNETSFNCSHCGALAKQFWFHARGKSFEDDQHPSWWDEDGRGNFTDGIQDEAQLADLNAFFDRLLSRRPFLEGSASSEYTLPIFNLNFSRCYNCKEIAIWMGEGMLWPNRGSVARPNTDMPQDALTDYVEAAEIVNKSPRGAAALLRLAIQKICMHLGGKGHLNDDIAKLVENGLDVRVQQSLDVVRVVGNNAVHPGELDISDN